MRVNLLLLVMLMMAAAQGAGCRDDGPDDATPVEAAAQSVGATSSDGVALPGAYLSPAFPKLTFDRPVFITHAGDGSKRLFVVEQAGRIRVFENRYDVEETEVFLDIREQVLTRHNEEGLLSLAFHRKYAETGTFFVYYSAGDPRRGVLSRFTVKAEDANRADRDSEVVILQVEQPWGNHNGATILFGPEGYLYLSLGDGGSAGDPRGHGQNLGTLLGSIIRIDVDQQEGGRPYAIPADNPFVDRAGARPEIWAYGLRNVWRMSYDGATGRLWAGDVGQNSWEEIDLIVKGGNYGWNLREGGHGFRGGDAAAGVELIDPVIEYGRREGKSVTGGIVYRGRRNAKLRGAYLYGDYVSGEIWGLRYEDESIVAHRALLSGDRREHVTSFGEDADGELYLCVFDRLDGGRGRIMRLSEL